MIQPTWADRELPILRGALRRLDTGEPYPSLEEIRLEVGLDVNQMRAGLTALATASPPYIDVAYVVARDVEGHVKGVSERTRRELGSWPSADELIRRVVVALTDAAASEQEPERKSRLRSAAEVLGGMGQQLAVQVAAAYIGRV